MRRLAAAAAFLVAAAWLLWPADALGHAALVRSDPAANAFLQRAPGTVTVVFAEIIDSRSSELRILDAKGAPLATSSARDFGTDRVSITLPVPVLPPGIYNVLWANVSAVDGHALQGSFPFTVLNPDGSLPSQTNALSGLSNDSDPPPQGDSVATKALALLGLVIVAGAAAVALMWPRGDRTPELLGRAVLVGAAVLAVASLLNLVVLRNTYKGLSLPDLLLQTRGGGYLLARFGAALLMAAVGGYLATAPRRAAAGLLAAVGVTAWAFSATSHGAAGAGSNLAIPIDLIHRMVGLIWIGAVVGLAISCRLAGRSQRYRNFMPRFSLLASVLVFILFSTGLLNSLVQIDRVSGLVETRYGLTLLVKLAAILPLLAVAGYNARWGRRRLLGLASGEPRRFILTATAEAVLGLGVIFLAVMLSQSTVTKAIVDTGSAPQFRKTATAADLLVAMSVDPNRTGLNTFRATLTDAAKSPAAADFVRITFRYQDDGTVGPSTLTLARTGPGIFVGQGPYLTLEGQWRMEVEVRRAGKDDAKAFFDIRPAGLPADLTVRSGAWADPAAGLTWNQFGGLVALLGGLGFAFWGGRLGTLGRRWGWSANGMTVLAFGVGAVLLFGVHSHETLAPGVAKLTNPIFPDQNSITTGRTLYLQNCATCHGLNGVPPKGLNLDPYPLDLSVHVPQHSDPDLFTFISRGFPGTAMRSWAEGDGKLTTDQIWHLVNFLRTFTPVDR